MTNTLEAWYVRWQVRLLLVAGQKSQALVRIERHLATRAHLKAEMGDKPGAIASIERLVQVHPNQASAWFNLGFLCEETGRLDDAEAAFRRATEIEPKLDRAWYGLALCLIRLRRFDDAVVALRKNTELQPMSPYGWYQLARVHVDRQEPEEAAKIIRHLRQFEPKVAAQLERETGLGVSPT
jgi:Flp pilus assembly protein TadD